MSNAASTDTSAEMCRARWSHHAGEENRCIIATVHKSNKTGGTTVGSVFLYKHRPSSDRELELPWVEMMTRIPKCLCSLVRVKMALVSPETPLFVDKYYSTLERQSFKEISSGIPCGLHRQQEPFQFQPQPSRIAS